MNKTNNMPNNILSDIYGINIPYNRKFSKAKHCKNRLHLWISKNTFLKSNSSLVVTESDPCGIGISIFENDPEKIQRLSCNELFDRCCG